MLPLGHVPLALNAISVHRTRNYVTGVVDGFFYANDRNHGGGLPLSDGEEMFPGPAAATQGIWISDDTHVVSAAPDDDDPKPIRERDDIAKFRLRPDASAATYRFNNWDKLYAAYLGLLKKRAQNT